MLFFSSLLAISLIGCGEENNKSLTQSPDTQNPATQQSMTNNNTLTKQPKILFAVAGDSKRADDAAEEEIFYSRWLKDFGVDYLHTAVTSIESKAWTDGATGTVTVTAQLPRIINEAKKYGKDGENVIIAYELGTNDIDHCKSRERINASTNPKRLAEIEKECEPIVLKALTTGITAIKTALPNASVYLSRPALAAKPHLKTIYEALAKNLNLLLVDSPIEKYMEKDPKNPKVSNPKAFAYLKDNTHPSYAGMFAALYADLNCILPAGHKAKLEAKRTESLYSDTSAKQGVNIAAGIKLENSVISNDKEGLKENDNFRSMTVPVIGGSILKINLKIKSIKLLGNIFALDKNNKGVDANSLTDSKIAKSWIRKTAADSDKDEGVYEFMYIPKGTAKIVINLATGMTLKTIDMKLKYATPDEMKKWHPDLKEITANTAECKGTSFWDMKVWQEN